jgi:hypothetical protein
MKCPSCRNENWPGAKFRGSCAGPLLENVTYTACGSVNLPRQNFFDECEYDNAARNRFSDGGAVHDSIIADVYSA